MKKTTKQYSYYLSKEAFSELKTIARRYGKVKNYVFSRYGSINGLQYLKYPRTVRDEWTKTEFAKQWGLSARYWKLALEEAFGNIKTNWSQTKQSVRDNIRKRGLSKEEAHYVNYAIKANDVLHKILTYQDYEIDDKFECVNQDYLNKIIRRLVRKYHHHSISKKYRSFMVDNYMYNYTNGRIDITSLTPRKRLKIGLTDGIVKTGHLRVVIRNSKLEIHPTHDVKIKENNNEAIIAIDKGFRDMVVTSNNTFYGKKLSDKLIKLSNELSTKNKQRNKLYALTKKLEERGSIKKANKIKKYNLGKIKYNNRKFKVKAAIESFVNKSLNEFILEEKPKTVIVEDLSFTGKKTKFKKVNRWLSSWIKGYLQDRLEYKCEENSIELAKVNAAYTSQICHKCDRFGERKGDKFYCDYHGVVHADYNASKNVYNRHFDDEISLFTPYKKVKEILLSRLSEKLSEFTVPTKNREIAVVGTQEIPFVLLNQSDSELHKNT